MLLFKYMPLQAAQKILDSKQIGFRRAHYFNDPFDTPVASPIPTDNPNDKLFADLNSQLKSDIWEKNTAFLCLTRTATNSLMWAHYADAHRGTVLAIDMSIAGFLNVETNFIPAHFGSVTYSRHRFHGPYSSKFGTAVVVGETHHFVPEHYEKWQRIFLTKPLEWAYEEEVRIAKCIHGLAPDGGENASGTCSVINAGGNPLHCFDIPENCIRRIYFGARVSQDKINETITIQDGIEYFRTRLNQKWNSVEAEPL